MQQSLPQSLQVEPSPLISDVQASELKEEISVLSDPFEVLCYGSWGKLRQISGQGDMALWERIQIKISGAMSNPIKPFCLKYKLRVPLEDLEGKPNKNPGTLITKSDQVFTNTCCQDKQNWLILEPFLPNGPVYKSIPKSQLVTPLWLGKQMPFTKEESRLTKITARTFLTYLFSEIILNFHRWPNF